MKKVVLLFLLILFPAVPGMSAKTKSKIMDFGGTRLEILETKPKGKDPYPLLVIAPAKQYAMTEKIFERLSEEAAKAGYFVVRFNWGFFSRGGQPSKDLSAEAKELESLLYYYADRPFIDQTRVTLAAKSFGSIVAMRGPQKRAKSLLLLTPNCSKKFLFSDLYKPIFLSKQPVHIVMSVADPYCSVDQVYGSLPALGARATVHTLTGDHNFELTTSDTLSERNVESVISSCVNWLVQRH